MKNALRKFASKVKRAIKGGLKARQMPQHVKEKVAGLKAHQLLHQIADAINAKNCFLLTSSLTGNPALKEISISKFETFVSAQYSSAIDLRNNRAIHRDIHHALSSLHKINNFDISFVDPYHTYEDSCFAIEKALTFLKNSGWMIVHDCFPPYELTMASHQAGDWCGTTFASFRDVATRGNRAWFVLDADFGLGVLGPQNTSGLIGDVIDRELVLSWDNADIEHKRELLKTNGRELMRVLPPEKMEVALPKLLNKEFFNVHEI